MVVAKLVGAVLVVVTAVVLYPVISIWSQLRPGQQWALYMQHNVSSQSRAEHARYRYTNDGYDKHPNVFHFQVILRLLTSTIASSSSYLLFCIMIIVVELSNR
jgi:hypothetical protein